MFTTSAEAAGTGVVDRLNALKSKFPDGYYWNHRVTNSSETADNLSNQWKAGNHTFGNSFSDSVTRTKCYTHDGTCPIGQYDCNYFDGGMQCWGFANKIFYEVFHVYRSKMAIRTDIANVQVGDYIRWGTDDYGHSCIVTARSGNMITVVECNFTWEDYCVIRWGRTIDIYGTYYGLKLSYFCHASNYDEINGTPSQPTATAQNLGNDFYAYISNPISGCNVENSSNNVQLARVNKTDPRQIWHFTRLSDTDYKITNLYDGRCLDTNGPSVGGVQVLPYVGNAYQRWRFYGSSASGPFYVAPYYYNSNHSYVLDVWGGGAASPGTNIQLYLNWYLERGSFDDPKVKGQSFTVQKIDNINEILAFDMGADFYARITFNGMCFVSTTPTNGQNTNVELAARNVTDTRQIWHFIRQSNGSYKITNEYTDWSMDLYGGIAANTANVGTWYSDSFGVQDSKRWYIVQAKDTGYSILPAVLFPEYAIDIPYGNTATRTNVEIFQRNWDYNQEFGFEILPYTKPAAPAAPTNIRVSATSSGTTITWNMVPKASSYDIRGYNVYLRDTATGEYRLFDYIDTNRYTTNLVLEPGDYQVMVRAVNSAYYYSLGSDLSVLNFSTMPAVQTYAIQVSAGTGGIVSGGGVYSAGDQVTVTATPGIGYQFSCWRNTATNSQVSSSASYTFLAQENLSLAAEFVKTTSPVQTYAILASAGEGGTVIGGGSYKEGASATVRATAASGYDFVNWVEDGAEVSTEATYTFTVNGNRNLTAVFEKQDPDDPDTPAVTHVVRVDASPSAGGTVSGGGTYEENASVTVTATSNDGYRFVEWRENGGKVSESASFDVTVNRNRELTAVFEEEPSSVSAYTVHVGTTDGGTVTGGGTYPESTSVTVRATAASGYRFVAWEENGSTVSTDASYTFNISQDTDLIAVFEKTGSQTPVTAYEIRVDAAPFSGGTVTGGGVYMDGDSVTVTAVPNGAYHFVKWAENGNTVSETASYTFTADSSRTLTAVFETEAGTQTHTVAVSASPTGSGTVTGGGTYQTGDLVTITATPGDDYQFVEWRLNDRQISTTATYTFTASADQTYTAIFEKQDDTPTPPAPPTPTSYTISISASPAAGGTVSGEGRYEENASVTVTAVPNSGYRFVRWTESGREISKSTNYSFTANANHVFVAEFASAAETPGSSGNSSSSSSTGTSSGSDHSGGSESNSLPVSVGSISHGTVTSSVSRAKKGDKVILTVHPNSGYTLETLTVKDSGGKTVATAKESDSQYSFIMPATRVSINAVFALEQPSAKQTFKDVPESYWAETEISWATENGIMGGFGDETFRPDNQVTRQQAWMVLGRTAGASPTSMAAARSWAMEHGISDGTTPGSALTRQQLVALLYRYAQLQGYDISDGTDISAYPDDASVANYAKGAMAWAVGNGIIGGTSDGRLNPTGTATRAQFVVIMYRFNQKSA